MRRPGRPRSTSTTARSDASGSTSGRFWALDAATGQPVWSFDAGAEIYHSPAAHDGRVYFGVEDMHAYCLDAASGKLQWKSKRLAGYTFGQYWPVIVAQHGAVMFRTASITGVTEAYQAIEKSPPDYDKAQAALAAHYRDNPAGRSFFILDLSNGKEKLFLPTGRLGCSGDLVAPPLVLAGGKVLAAHYANVIGRAKPARLVRVDTGHLQGVGIRHLAFRISGGVDGESTQHGQSQCNSHVTSVGPLEPTDRPVAGCR